MQGRTEQRKTRRVVTDVVRFGSEASIDVTPGAGPLRASANPIAVDEIKEAGLVAVSAASNQGCP